MAAKKRHGKSRRKEGRGGRRRQRTAMPFHARNYKLMVVGLVIVAIGYAIMAAENEVDGFLSLYVSPILLLAGYMEIIYAIVWRPKSDDDDSG